MPFVWRDQPENADLIWLARGFAEQVAAGELDVALRWAAVAEDVFHGGYAFLERDDGGCQVVTREARHCPFPARPGELVCGLHARYIEAKKADV